jgi:hypothetical protein
MGYKERIIIRPYSILAVFHFSTSPTKITTDTLNHNLGMDYSPDQLAFLFSKKAFIPSS